MKQFKIYFDGGARPTNPGNGYGSFTIESKFDTGTYTHAGHRIEFGRMTNNAAEYRALIVALEALRGDVLGKKTPEDVYFGGITLSIFSDSRLVVEQLNGRWRVKKADLKVLVERCWSLLIGFGHWQIRWNARQVNVDKFGH